MSIRTAIRDWLNKPSRQELRARALDARLNDIECEVISLEASISMLESHCGLKSRDSSPLSSPESFRLREVHRRAEGC